MIVAEKNVAHLIQRYLFYIPDLNQLHLPQSRDSTNVEHRTKWKTTIWWPGSLLLVPLLSGIVISTIYFNAWYQFCNMHLVAFFLPLTRSVNVHSCCIRREASLLNHIGHPKSPWCGLRSWALSQFAAFASRCTQNNPPIPLLAKVCSNLSVGGLNQLRHQTEKAFGISDLTFPKNQ